MNSINKFKKPINISSVVIAPRLSIASNSALFVVVVACPSETEATTTTVADDKRSQSKLTPPTPSPKAAAFLVPQNTPAVATRALNLSPHYTDIPAITLLVAQ
jgi:hypothetical protein